MFYLNESEREYRHGDHGPKYLEQGPRMNFGVVMLQPGNTVSPHVHRVMQESFFFLISSSKASSKAVCVLTTLISRVFLILSPGIRYF